LDSAIAKKFNARITSLKTVVRNILRFSHSETTFFDRFDSI